jgi:hypothetical protein
VSDSSVETLQPSVTALRAPVETFQIKVMPGEPPHGPRVLATWRDSERVGEIELDSLRMRTLHTLVDLLRTNRLTRIDEFKLLGEYLFVTLFGSTPSDYGPRSLFMKAVKALPLEGESRRRLMQVSLEIDADVEHLGSWPWEYLYVPEERNDRDTDFFLGDRMNFILTRRLPLSAPEHLEGIRPPLRILFVVLSPTAPDPAAPAAALLTRIEYEAVLETLLALRDEEGPLRINLSVLAEEHADDGTKLPPEKVGSMTRATFGAFRRIVAEYDPHVVHIIGHGRYRYDEGGKPSGQIAFPNTDSTPNWVLDWDLSNALRDIDSLRLVFLQACESAETQSSPYQVISGMSQWLAQRGIPAVIAMHFRVESKLANEFARSFYEKLPQRIGIEVAMHAARRQLYVGGVMGEAERGAFGLPVLYLRGSGALLTPLEVPTPPRAVVESMAAEPPGPISRDAQRYGDQVSLRPLVREAERRQDARETRERIPAGKPIKGSSPENRDQW